MMKTTSLIPIDHIQQKILRIREYNVILDADLAAFYGVTTKALNQAVKRNPGRFPEDFMFQLTPEEKEEVVTVCDHLPGLKFSPHPPRAFTEHGAIMAASVLNSQRAADVSVFIVRAFIRLRQTFGEQHKLAEKLTELENKLAQHDQQICAIVQAIRQLTSPKPPPEKRRIGFHPGDNK